MSVPLVVLLFEQIVLVTLRNKGVAGICIVVPLLSVMFSETSEIDDNAVMTDVSLYKGGIVVAMYESVVGAGTGTDMFFVKLKHFLGNSTVKFCTPFH